MDGIREVARAYYDTASEEEKKSIRKFFKRLDSDGDGKISLDEFRRSVSSWLSDESLFQQLDADGDGGLGFDESLALYYMVEKVSILRCNGCRKLLLGPYFSCLACLEKTPTTFDLCCACFCGGNNHHHPRSSFSDHHALLMLFRYRTQKTPYQREMEELREIAKAHYRAGSREVRELAKDFFRSMDTDGDGRVSLPEFLAFMREEGYTQMRNPYFFKELDSDGNGTLDFVEVLTLYYIIKSGRPFCDWCGHFIPGIFFSCVECYKNPQSSFSLCSNCYKSSKCTHNHGGRSQFLDNYTLLQAKKDAVLAKETGVNQDEQPGTSQRTSSSAGQVRSPVTSNEIVPNANLYGPTYHTYFVNPSHPMPNVSNAIVPAASRMRPWRMALRALEIGLSIGSISTTLCTIL